MEVVKWMHVMALCVVYVILSTALIGFNSQLMHPDRFPHAMLVTTFHMTCTCVSTVILYLVCPNMFPTVGMTEGKRIQLIKWFFPLGVLFAIGLYCSHRAYLYCSASFLQFMKEANIVLVYSMSCGCGLNTWTRAKVVNIMWIIAGASIAVTGEVHFLWTGFILQAVSQVGECSKNVLGDWLMNGSDLKLDPLTYTLFMAPMCLMVLVVGNFFAWNSNVLPDLAEWWPILIPNSFLAFSMNITIALLIKETSAIVYIMAGLVKDILIVLLSAGVFHESVVRQQYIGFMICLSGVFFWSYSKISPDSVPVLMFEKVCFTNRASGELQPLIHLPKEATNETPESSPEEKNGV